MKKTVAILGALDTKGAEFEFLKNEIEKRGCGTFVINSGVLGQAPFTPDVSAEEVAQAGGTPLSELIKKEDRGEAVKVMTNGTAKVVLKYYQDGKFDGIISIHL